MQVDTGEEIGFFSSATIASTSRLVAETVTTTSASTHENVSNIEIDETAKDE